MAAARVRKASWMSSRISQRMRRRRDQCSSVIVGSMIHRCAALQEQADHLEMTVRDRPVQAGPPEVGRDVGADAEVKEPAHDLGPAVLAGVDKRLCNDLLRIVGCRDPGRKADYVGGVGARRRGVRLASSQSRNPVMAAASMRLGPGVVGQRAEDRFEDQLGAVGDP